MDLNFAFIITVTFFSAGKRKAPPDIYGGRYSPHFVVKGDDEYLGVCFIELDSSEFDRAAKAVVLPVYEGVHYDKLQVRTSFFIMEGPNIVGEGMVNEIVLMDYKLNHKWLWE